MSKRVTSLCSTQLPTSADNVALLAFAAAARRAAAAAGGLRCRSVSPVRRAHNSKPATAACSGRYMQQTDGRTPHRYIDPVTYYASTVSKSIGWLGCRAVSLLDSGAVEPGFKLQPRRCRVTVLGKLFTPIVPLFIKQRNW